MLQVRILLGAPVNAPLDKFGKVSSLKRSAAGFSVRIRGGVPVLGCTQQTLFATIVSAGRPSGDRG